MGKYNVRGEREEARQFEIGERNTEMYKERIKRKKEMRDRTIRNI